MSHEGTENDRTYQCEECSAIFYTRDGLRRHIYKYHLQQDALIESMVERAAAASAGKPDVETAVPSTPAEGTKDYIGTHKVLRNGSGKCVVLLCGHQAPPGWSHYYPGQGCGSEENCQGFVDSACGQYNQC